MKYNRLRTQITLEITSLILFVMSLISLVVRGIDGIMLVTMVLGMLGIIIDIELEE